MKKSFLALLAFLLLPSLALAQSNYSNTAGIRAYNSAKDANKVVAVAGEEHLGEVGGNQITVNTAPTVTASSAYASGNAVGGLMTVSNAARVAAGSGLLQSVVVYFKSAQTAPVDVFLFSSNPSASTFTDKTALSVNVADYNKILGVAHVTDCTSAGTPTICQAQNLAMPYALPSGTTMYAVAVTRGTPTFSSTSDVSVSFRFLRN